MPLTPGTRLGVYEVSALLGAGGMGEVYKARDTRLDRTVAIKVLPASLASDRQFRDRFDREARTISQLDHPHICALYDVGDQEGTAFLVMQYLEGETLERRLKKGALPINEGITIAVQIADALDKAHRAGIVHRDIKPGNIMVTKSGAKLLDFGLAKATASVGVAPGLSMLPTTPPNLTAQGTLLGTFQYMAPEQLEGQEADARTDIFAFGAVVYEMLTGKKAFEGKSQASLISSIMTAEPSAVSSIQKLTPPALEQLIARCLAKDPDDRWQSARDVKLQLAWIAGGTADPRSAAVTASSSSRKWLAWTATTAVIGLALAAILVTLRWTRVNENARSTRFLIPTGPVVGLALGAQIAVSPDGTRVAFVAQGPSATLIFIRSFDAVDAQPLAGTEGAVGVFWSPDGRRLGFGIPGKLKTIDVAGGAPQDVSNIAGVALVGASWNADGVILFSSGPGRPIQRVSASGGDPVAATSLDEARGEVAHLWPMFLPDGRHFLFMAGASTVQSRAIYVGSLDSKDRVEVVRAASNPVYAEPGYLLFHRSGTLMAQHFDAKRLALSGDAIRVVDGVAYDVGNGSAAFSVAGDGAGVLAYRHGNAGALTQLTWHDRSGKALGSIGPPAVYRGIALSPDDKRVAAHVHQDPDGGDIWILEPERGTSTRFTFTQSHNIAPMWSSGGRFIVFASNRDGKGLFNLYQKSASGAGDDELIQKAPKTQFPEDSARDGQSMLYGELDPKGLLDIWALPLSGERRPVPVVNTGAIEMFSKFSPDGRWVAYMSNESGRMEVYVQPYPQTTGKWQISAQGGGYPRWAHSGKELFYVADPAVLMAVDVQAADGAFRAFHTSRAVQEQRRPWRPHGFSPEHSVRRIV